MNAHASLAHRTTLAVLLTFGFYLLALAVAGGLLYVPYAEYRTAGRPHFALTVACVVGAALILWSILPRFDRFKAPGPALVPQTHPQLFQTLESVAHATGQAMPTEVYLVPGVEAWVAQRGGFLGLGSRRVMGLGLALLCTLTHSQLRAVLAHEFGHFHGGDTAQAAWVYRTRDTMLRTLDNLGETGGPGVLVQLPFFAYTHLFLRITNAASRHQELVADTLAAETVGARPLIEGLERIHGAAPLFDAYWGHEVEPVLDAGFLPPWAEGFPRFLRAEPVAEMVRIALAEADRHPRRDPHDPHPPLRERVAALGERHRDDVDDVDDDAAPASTLLADVPALEREVLAWSAGAETVGGLERITWDQATDKVLLPEWARRVAEQRAHLRGLTPEEIPSLLRDEQELLERFPDGETEGYGRDLATETVGAALTLLLRERGWTVSADLGAAVVVRHGADELQPFDLLAEPAKGSVSTEAWQAHCERWGIAGYDLGRVSTTDA